MRLPVLRALALALVVAGAGCSYFQDASQAEGNIVSPTDFRAGSGVIESVGVLPNANKAANKSRRMASAGGTRPDPNLYRLWLNMDAGGFQTVDTDNGGFMAGEAVELTNDGRVVHISGTTINKALKK